MGSSVSARDEIWFLCLCHHVSNAVYLNLVKECFLPRGLSNSLFIPLLTQIPLKLNLEVSWDVTSRRLVKVYQSIRCYLTENLNLQCRYKNPDFFHLHTKYTNQPYLMHRCRNSKHVRPNGQKAQWI